MSIYARFGEDVKVLRYATKADVLKLDPPFDTEAKKNLKNKSWVVIEFLDDGRERISHLAYLRADGGLAEIMDALRDAEVPPGLTVEQWERHKADTSEAAEGHGDAIAALDTEA